MHSNAVPRTTEDQKLFKELDYASKHIIVNRDALEGEQENLKWEGVTGSLTSAIERKLDSETDMDALSNRFRVFDVTCVTLLVNQVVVPI